MKKTLLTLSMVFAVLVSIAQDNAVKWNVGSVLLGTGYFSYERALTDHSSVTGGFHFTKAGLPGTFADIFDTEEDAQDGDVLELNSPTLTGFGFTAEYRMYTSNTKEGMSGFFFAPFIRHSQYTIGVDAIYVENDGDRFVGNQSITLKNNIGVGVVIGTHFNVGQHFSIDVTWFGLGVSMSKLKGEITTDDPTVDFRDATDDIVADIKENSYIKNYDISQNKVEVSSTGFPLPIIRGNIAIGYRF